MNPKTAGPSLLKKLGNHFRTNTKFRKRILWTGSIAAVFSLILVAIPMITASVATAWLRDNGASAARIDNIDINLFTGRVRLAGLEAGGSADQRLSIGQAELDLRWWPLASKHILVEAIRLSDTQIDISSDTEGAWQVGGLRFDPAQSTPQTPEEETGEPLDWGIGSETIALTNVTLTYRDGLFDTDVAINQVSIGNHYSWQAGEETELVIDMDVNGSPINLNSDVVPWGDVQSISGALSLSEHDLADHAQALQQLAGLDGTHGTVSLDLTLTASLDESGRLDLAVTGPVALNNIGFTRDTLAFDNQRLDWQSDIQMQWPASAGEPLLRVGGALTLGGTQVALDEIELSNQALDWQGDVALFYPATPGQTQVQVAGELALQDTQAQLSAWEMNVSLDSLEVAPELALSAAESPETAPGLALSTTLVGQGLAVNHARLPYALARLESLRVGGLQVSDISTVSLEQLQLQGLQMLSDTETEDTAFDVFSLDDLTLTQADYAADTGVMIEAVTLNEPALRIIRNADGDIDRVTELLAVFSGDAAEDTLAETGEDTQADAGSDAQSAASFPVAINQVQIQSGNLLDFQDMAVTPQVSFQLISLELGVTAIDTASDSPMALEMSTGNGTFLLTLAGEIAAFADPLAVNLQANMQSLELPRFSSYIPGYNIDRGRLSTDATIAINGDMLDVQNTVLLEQIRLAGKVGEDNAILAQGMSMPLDKALDMLRDGDDNIELDLPVTGSLSEPRFNSADIIRTVMQNALQNAAMSYVTNALQPLGTILLVRDLATQAAAPRFAPSPMTAGAATLSVENREYLFKIGDLLSERPGLQLSMCGVASAADRQVLAAQAQETMLREAEVEDGESTGDSDTLPQTSGEAIEAEPSTLPGISDAALLQLAASRTDIAIEFLAEEAGIDSERLFTCRETIDDAEDGEPRLRISL